MVRVDDVLVTNFNRQGSNGFVHTTDGVFHPVPFEYIENNILERLSEFADFSRFVDGVRLAHLEFFFVAIPHVTVFVPTNAAINARFATQEAFVEHLRDLYSYLVFGEYDYEDLLANDGQVISSIVTRPLFVATEGPMITVNGVVVSNFDIRAENGVAHVLADVLPEFPSAGGSRKRRSTECNCAANQVASYTFDFIGCAICECKVGWRLRQSDSVRV